MATASSAALLPAMVTVKSGGARAQMATNRGLQYARGLNSYGGLKAHNNVVSLGIPDCTEQCFAKMVSSINAVAVSGENGRKGGGALSSTCNAVAEIFKIAAIMNGLVLVGVAIGFVLLRVEATLEESE